MVRQFNPNEIMAALAICHPGIPRVVGGRFRLESWTLLDQGINLIEIVACKNRSLLERKRWNENKIWNPIDNRWCWNGYYCFF